MQIRTDTAAERAGERLLGLAMFALSISCMHACQTKTKQNLFFWQTNSETLSLSLCRMERDGKKLISFSRRSTAVDSQGLYMGYNNRKESCHAMLTEWIRFCCIGWSPTAHYHIVYNSHDIVVGLMLSQIYKKISFEDSFTTFFLRWVKKSIYTFMWFKKSEWMMIKIWKWI